jgi:hypothetical protein
VTAPGPAFCAAGVAETWIGPRSENGARQSRPNGPLTGAPAVKDESRTADSRPALGSPATIDHPAARQQACKVLPMSFSVWPASKSVFTSFRRHPTYAERRDATILGSGGTVRVGEGVGGLGRPAVGTVQVGLSVVDHEEDDGRQPVRGIRTPVFAIWCCQTRAM